MSRVNLRFFQIYLGMPMETIRERVKRLCKEQNISLNQLEKDCGFAKGYLSKLDKSTPNARNIQLIATRLNNNVDYILGKTAAEIVIEHETNYGFDKRLASYFNKLTQLSDEHIDKIFHDIEYYAEQEKKNK